MNKPSVEEEWQKFLYRLEPTWKKWSSLQYKEMKKAFYGGFGGALSWLIEVGGSEEITEEQGAKYAQLLFNEIHDFWKKETQEYVKLRSSKVN